MTLEESLETVPDGVRVCIQDVIDRAGTSDADWAVLKAAGELLDRDRVKVARLANRLHQLDGYAGLSRD